MSLSVKIPTFFTNSIIFIIQRFFFSEFFFHCQILPVCFSSVRSQRRMGVNGDILGFFLFKVGKNWRPKIS